MKVFISADIEGVAGCCHWDETKLGNPDYVMFQKQMNQEVLAICEGAVAAGAKEIWIKDAHHTARNLDAAKLPDNVILIRGWSGHPFSMVQELNESFDALAFIGYHSPSGSGANPLAHTMTTRIHRMTINDQLASEFMLHAYVAGLKNVPVCFLSGDEGICEEASSFCENLLSFATKRGTGGRSVVSKSPQLSVEMIRTLSEEAFKQCPSETNIKMPDEFVLTIDYREPSDAYSKSFYPGAEQLSDTKIGYCTENYFEILRMLHFCL